MPRIGNQPIEIAPEVKVTVGPHNVVGVQGPKGTLSQKVDPDVTITIQDNTCLVEIPTQQKRHKALQGLYRSLIHNMVTGVKEGYTKTLEIIGIGYKVSISSNNLLEFYLGYAHTIHFLLPEEIEASVESKGKNPKLILKSHDKQLLGQVTANIRALRKPEPYKGKGIRIQGEYVRRKQGKTASA